MNREATIEEVDNGFIIRIANTVTVFATWRKAREYLDGFYGDNNEDATSPTLDPDVWNSGYPHR